MLKYSWQVHGLVNFYCEDYLTTIVSRVNQATHSVATLDSAVSLLSLVLATVILVQLCHSVIVNAIPATYNLLQKNVPF